MLKKLANFVSRICGFLRKIESCINLLRTVEKKLNSTKSLSFWDYRDIAQSFAEFGLSLYGP